MAQKKSLQYSYSTVSDPEQMQHAFRRRLRLSAMLLLVISALLWLVRPAQLLKQHPPVVPPAAEKQKVPLEIHIMSKCPDARDCLKGLILPTMEKVISKVNFTMSYIGKSTDDDGVECMHGETECLGNMVELCSAYLYPDPEIYLGFTMCLSKDYKKIPQEAFVEDCALEHSVDMGKLNSCMSKDDGEFGLDMLRSSFNRSQNVGAVKSCTVRLDNKVRCIRDGGEWTDCEAGSSVESLIRDVNKLYDNSSSSSM